MCPPLALLLVTSLLVADSPAPEAVPEASSDQPLDVFDASEDAAAASNPLSSTSKLDFRLDYFDLDGSTDRFDANIKGDLMLHPRLKLNYEAHYWSTNVTGETEDDWESVSLKPIFFVDDVKLSGGWQLRIAAGLEWIIDADNADKGIGSGSDQVAPLLGLAFNDSNTGLTLIPLVQQFQSYDGPSVTQTALRMIVLKPLPDAMWLRLDTKIPYDWMDDTVPMTFELELGKMLSPAVGIYGTGFAGIGGDRPYEWGLGAALRFRF